MCVDLWLSKGDGVTLKTAQPRIDAEIEVSNLLCANCHQEETRSRNTAAS